MPPLVVSLHVDARGQAEWDALRRKHFPPHRLVVDAHLTLFHALPGDHETDVLTAVTEACRDHTPFPLTPTRYYSLGGGVALKVESPNLVALHAALRRPCEPWLTRQDAQPFHPHVTLQNKVDPALARTTLAELSARPLPAPARALGVSVWHYVGGPWEHVHTELFPEEAG